MNDKRANESFAELFKNKRAAIVAGALIVILLGLGAAYVSGNLT